MANVALGFGARSASSNGLLLRVAIILLFVATSDFSAIAAPVKVTIGDVPGSGAAHVPPGSANGPEGLGVDFFDFDATKFSQMYFGIDPDHPPTTGFNGEQNALSFSQAIGTTAIWLGSGTFTQPASLPRTVPLRFTIDVTGLGANPWIDPNSVGLPAGGAIAADPLGLDFSILIHFQADLGNGFIPLNSAGAPASGSSVASAFYVVRPLPEPAAITTGILAAIGFAVVAVARRRTR